MNYEIKFGGYSGVFALPAEAADKYINEATPDGLKVLLYVFRRAASPLDGDEACKDLGLTPGGLAAALDFWAARGIIALGAPSPAPAVGAPEPRPQQAVQMQAAAAACAAEAPFEPREKPARRVIDMPTQYGQEEIAKKSQSNPEIKFLLETVPTQLGRLISPAECSTLVYLYEGAGLPADVILMLVGYCVSVGKGNLRYIEKMAVGWAEEGIDTHDRAERKIRELEERRSFEGQVRSAMGLNDRALSPTERQHVARWCGWRLPVELVKLAYDIGVGRTGKLSFSYINSILSSWHDKGFTTVEQARNENKKGRGDAKSPSFDIDEYVRLSMKTLHNE